MKITELYRAEDIAAEELREAVNKAIRSGNSPGAVRSIVQDQLFGIERFGNGDVDKMLEAVNEPFNVNQPVNEPADELPEEESEDEADGEHDVH